IIDGEITVLDPIRGHPQFLPLLQNEKTQMIYVVYDLLYLNGRDLRFWPLMRRKPKLAQLMRGVPKTLVIDYWEGSGKLYFQWICSQDLEGLVAKRRTDPYTERTIWYKVKNKNYSQRNVGRILNKKSRAK
ncbi:MAG TPA: hypothetical protein VL306_02325, partial [Methylomirabilota bacterium]|nr:hypothetical protein [Methylomirabilota bacterium]